MKCCMFEHKEVERLEHLVTPRGRKQRGTGTYVYPQEVDDVLGGRWTFGWTVRYLTGALQTMLN